MALRRGVEQTTRTLIAAALLVMAWSLGLFVARHWQLDGWLIRTWLLVPTAACFVLATFPWRAHAASPGSPRRLWTAIAVAVILCIPAALFLGFLFWTLGPDCGVVADQPIRERYVVVALCLGLTTGSLPVAIAGRRPAALLAGGIPIAVLTSLGLMAAATNEPGWCLF
jgi:hypothetical protein